MNDGASLEAYLFYRHQRAVLDAALVSPQAKTFIVHARDGYPIAASKFEPALRAARGSAPPTVVIASATGVRRRYYEKFASWLATRGMPVVTFDYRGIGDSRPESLARFRASLVDWAELDLAAVIDFAGPNVNLVGHSIGGQLFGLLPDPAKINAAVLIASQSGDFRLWPSVADRARLGALWYAVVPSVASTLGYLPGLFGIGEDLPGGVAREWARWCRTRDYMVGGENAARREGYRKLAAPLWSLSFEDDDYAPPATVDALLALYENASITRRHVTRAESRVGHFGFFRERFRPTLWNEAATFLDAHSVVAS